MKKILLFAAATVAAVAVNAQQSISSKGGQVKFNKSAERVVSFNESMVSNEILVAQEQNDVEATTTTRPRKSKATGLYYSAPVGCMYYNWNTAGSGYGPTYVIVPSKTEFTFNNMSTSPLSTKWHLNYLNNGRYLDVTEDADETGSYTYALNPGYYLAAPTITNEALTDSFTIGATTNSYWSKGGSYATYFTRISTDSLFNVGPLDDHCSAYGWGSLAPNKFLYGSGTLNNATYGLGVCTSVSQTYPKPLKPLYIEDMYIRGKSAGETPIPEGKKLYIYIYKLDENEPTYILSAGPEDVITGKTSTSANTTTGTYTNQTVVFSQKGIDPLTGEEVAEPIVIDFPYELYVMGLDQEGIDLGWNGADVQDQDAEAFSYVKTDGSTAIDNTTFWVKYEDGKTRGHGYSGTVMFITYDCMFDDVEPATSLIASSGAEVEDVNFVVVDNNGETNKSYSLFGSNIPGAYVSTLQDWFGADEDEYYSIAENEEAEWVTYATATPNDDNYNYIVAFTTEPLPAGVEYRYAKLFLQTRAGKLAETPIYVMQGDADKAYAEIKGQETKDLPGDANGDESVSVADLALMASFILGEQVEINAKNADVNGDGEITVADLAAVASMILNAE